jgi:hypothetical protein
VSIVKVVLLILLFRVSLMLAQLDIDPNDRPVNINAIVYKAPGVRLVRVKGVFGQIRI